MTSLQTRQLLCSIAVAATLLGCARAMQPSAVYDVILRGGTILDGTGAPRYVADIAVSGDRIARIGNLASARGTVDIDVKGLMVAPGFFNLHSHASAAGLTSAVNMLTQGVTTEILNPDGGGPLDVGQQLARLQDAGLAINAGAYIGFNSVWSAVNGPTDKRPAQADIDSMRALIVRGLQAGAAGVSAGLDYKPAYFATVDEAIAILAPTRQWRTNFTNHDRLSPENNYSSRAGIAETVRIGLQTGMIPVYTHMKLQGHGQGEAAQVLDEMRRSAAAGNYVTADVYPYTAGATSLAALLIPGWAQDGGRQQMLARFRDPAQRARIIREGDEALALRFGGGKGVYLPQTQRELTDVMREMGVTSPLEAVVRLLEEGSPGAILRFGSEADVAAFVTSPLTSIACDCGATPPRNGRAGRGGHPRGYGTYPRVLRQYVRESRGMTWESAVRKMSGLPASTVGIVDRGFLAPGMYADIVVFDSATVTDHATFDAPFELSAGFRHVFVNGKAALLNGAATGVRAGKALHRTPHMPSRPLREGVARNVVARGNVAAGSNAFQLTLDVSQPAEGRRPTGTVRIVDTRNNTTIVGSELGLVQTGDKWASVTGRARLGSNGPERAFTVIVDLADPFGSGAATVVLDVEGAPPRSGPIAGEQVTVSVKPEAP